MTSRTVQPDEHRRLPELGVLVGHLADALRIKGDLLDVPGVHPRMARRWFAGERISHEARDQLFEAFLDAWLPVAQSDLATPLAWLRPALIEFGRRWDDEVSRLLAFSVPAETERLATIPLARLFVLDFAIRYGALRKSVARVGLDLPAHPLDTGLFGHVLLQVWQALGLGPVEAVAESIGVDVTTVQRWRAGALPNEQNLAALLKYMSRHGGRSEHAVALRLSVGVAAVTEQLTSLYGDWFEPLLDGAHEVSDHVHATVRASGVEAAHLKDLVVEGARSRVGRSIADDLAEQVVVRPPMFSELRLDFLALSGLWTDRLMRWSHGLHVPDHAVDKLLAEAPQFGTPGREESKELLQMVAKTMPRLLWKVTGFRDPMPDFTGAVQMKLPPKLAAMNWCQHAQEARSIGDLAQAIQHARTAISRDPELGYAHFLLGAYLGEHLRAVPPRKDDQSMVREALTECRLAWKFDPTLPIALNEVGIILSNVGRFDEAELAYAEAAEVCEGLEHHHYCRARNYLALGDMGPATQCFERTIQLRPDHLHAMAHLSVLYLVQGRKRDSNTLADRVRQRVGEDPREYAQDWMDPFYVRHLWVPRNGFRP